MKRRSHKYNINTFTFEQTNKYTCININIIHIMTLIKELSTGVYCSVYIFLKTAVEFQKLSSFQRVHLLALSPNGFFSFPSKAKYNHPESLVILLP